MQEEDHPETSSHPGPETDGRRKRQKVSRESTTTTQQRSLLENLRDRKYFERPRTVAQGRDFFNLILKHKSELPGRFRGAIPHILGDVWDYVVSSVREDLNRDDEWDSETEDWNDWYNDNMRNVEDNYEEFTTRTTVNEFYRLAKLTAKMFLFSLPKRETWRGPDANVDSQDEIELLIRLIPDVLKETSGRGNRRGDDEFDLLCHMTSTTKAIRFIPLIADLYAEFGMSDKIDGTAEVYHQLLLNTFLEKQLEKGADDHLHEESLAVLGCLRGKGYVKNEHTYMILKAFLCKVAQLKPGERSLDFMERRIRLLIEWNSADDKNKATNVLQDWVLKVAADKHIPIDGLFLLIRFDPEAALDRSHSSQND